MQSSLVCLFFFVSIFTSFEFRAEASPAETLIKHLSSLLQWTFPPPKPSRTDEDFIQFEKGHLVETVLEGRNKLGVQPYSIRVSSEGELLAVDAVNSNIVKITPPLSPYSRARLIAGSFEGYSGHVDGRTNDARFNHPKGVAMDDKGNIYVADTMNLAIRKIGEAGVTTIAGGKSNVAGYRDGPSEDAKFSTDFDVIFDGRTCSLLVVDRGNAALRQISLRREDCEDQNSSLSSSDIIMVVATVVVGYASCILQHGFGPTFFYKPKQKHTTKSKFEEAAAVEEPTLFVETVGEDKLAEWPSFGQLVTDLSKLALETLGSTLLQVIPASLRPGKSKKGLTPMKDSLIMPEETADPPPSMHKQETSLPIDENMPRAPSIRTDYTQQKSQMSRTATSKNPNTAAKHKSSKSQDISTQGFKDALQPGLSASKSQKERVRHRRGCRSGEVGFGITGVELPKAVEIKAVDYDDPKFDLYNIRSKRSADDLFRF